MYVDLDGHMPTSQTGNVDNGPDKSYLEKMKNKVIVASRVLKVGLKGYDVKVLQAELIKNGYKIQADGIYGSMTADAVRDYQKKHGLAVDGMAGEKTTTSLYCSSALAAVAANKVKKVKDTNEVDHSVGNSTVSISNDDLVTAFNKAMDNMIVDIRKDYYQQSQKEIEAQFIGMSLDIQQFSQEFAYDFMDATRGAASADRISEILEPKAEGIKTFKGAGKANLALPAPGESSFNIGERLVSKQVYKNYIKEQESFRLGAPNADSFFFNKPGANTATRSFDAAVNAGFTRQNIIDTINSGGNELVRIRFKLDKLDNVVVPGVSKIPGGIGEGTIPGTNDLFTGKGWTQNYLGQRGYDEFIGSNVRLGQDDIVNVQYLGRIKK